jgi:hypothetical protein
MSRIRIANPQPGCAALINAGDSKCERHRIQEQREYDHERKDDLFHRLYSGKAWRMVRKVKLGAESQKNEVVLILRVVRIFALQQLFKLIHRHSNLADDET